MTERRGSSWICSPTPWPVPWKKPKGRPVESRPLGQPDASKNLATAAWTSLPFAPGLTSESASRPSQVGHNRLGSDFYGTLLDVVGDELLHRPVQLELDFSAFEEEEVENAAV